MINIFDSFEFYWNIPFWRPFRTCSTQIATYRGEHFARNKLFVEFWCKFISAVWILNGHVMYIFWSYLDIRFYLAIKLGTWLYVPVNQIQFRKSSISAKNGKNFRRNSFCRLPESKFILQLETKTIFITNYHQMFIVRGFSIELGLFKEQNCHQNNPTNS